MIYFSAKEDCEFIEEFYQDVVTYLDQEGAVRQGGNVNDINEELREHVRCRERIAQGMPRAKRIARSLGMPVDLQSCPAPMVGGPVIPVNVFEAILNDDGHSPLPDQRKLDVLNQTIGSCREQKRKEFFQLINPLFWLNSSLVFILRAPFWLLETAGFKPESFEKSLAGKIVRFIEILAIIGLLAYFGFSDSEMKEIVRGLVM